MRKAPAHVRPLVVVAILALMGASPAAAQDDLAAWQQQIVDQLDMMDEQMRGAGFEPAHVESGLVAGGQSQEITVQLTPGQYLAAAVCDVDCSDVDLAVTLRGATLDSDVLEDDVPVVDFTASDAGKYVFTVAMITCETPTCGYGLRIYRGGASAAAPAGAGAAGASPGMDELAPWQQQIVEQLRSLDERVLEEGYSAAEADFGLLEAGAEERVTFSLPSGNYVAAAVCDNDCADLDLLLFDAKGRAVDEDVLTDAHPVVEFKGLGDYHFDVRMVSCSTPTCGWGLRVYRQD